MLQYGPFTACPTLRTDMQTSLTQAARCALAELIALHYESGLSATGKRTVVDLHDALKEHGEDMVDYQDDYAVLTAS
jgi:hypothetical protein